MPFQNLPSGCCSNTAGRLAAVQFGTRTQRVAKGYDVQQLLYIYSYNQAGRVTMQDLRLVGGQYSSPGLLRHVHVGQYGKDDGYELSAQRAAGRHELRRHEQPELGNPDHLPDVGPESELGLRRVVLVRPASQRFL
jgi:hypothetical protein